MGAGDTNKGILALLEDIELSLRRNSIRASSMGDTLLVYLIDMAVLQVRTKALSIDPDFVFDDSGGGVTYTGAREPLEVGARSS